MLIGCSECVCIAIESHRPALLRALLERPDVEYRDIYWSTLPSISLSLFQRLSAIPKATDRYSMSVELHCIEEDTDLSFVGRPDCGHMRFDVDLCIPFGSLTGTSETFAAYILVSLIKLAEWHSSDAFPATQILRESGKFDFDAPQFFHFNYEYSICSNITDFQSNYPPGPLQKRIYPWHLRYEFNVPLLHDLSESEFALNSSNSSFSMTPPDLIIYFGDCYDDYFSLNKYDGRFALLVKDPRRKVQPLEYEQVLFDSGFDLNGYLQSMNCGQFKREHLFDWFCDLPHEFDRETGQIIPKLVAILLQNGLSDFLQNPESSPYSFIAVLFYYYGDLANAIARQLLAVGYGRRELHSNCEHLLDEHLDATREHFELLGYSGEKTCEICALVDLFDAGPLTLQQLSRIAVRRAVGGSFFARRVRRLQSLLPPPLLRYVADPTELMPLESTSDSNIATY